ncbi:unnamed protein product [Trichogramma brassicae]|uniref:SOCS box domain-containing protein n=1 Tax=Trichogramma brassicae TaxID=86971 RepID=A0A6H5J5W4_9HYME|nr:unnamed protein product [Trichogramma brassicae]
MREKINWEIRNERRKFFCQFLSLIADWQGQLPNLRDIFRTDEIEWLLAEPVKTYGRNPEQFLDFVINTGYKDEDGKHLLRRTTPIHRSARRWFFGRDIVVRKLFRIYDKFDVNYVDEDGSSHFHIACTYGCVDAVKKFLELGQDPNLLEEKTGDSPLHFALQKRNNAVVELLLRAGSDPNLTNKKGSTALHLIIKIDADGSLTKEFLEICSYRRQPVEIDAWDNLGHTPLSLALRNYKKKAVETLLRNGADPNSVNVYGETPLYIMTNGWYEDDVVRLFFDISDALNRPVQINTRDNKGNTPLHFAVSNNRPEVTKFLLEYGADPNASNQEGSTPLHLNCKKDYNDIKLLQIFFETCDEIQRTVRVDVRDNLGQTPLQLAVSRLSLDAVDILLDRGADLSEFSFPTESLFKHIYKSVYARSKLQLASSVLRVLQHLQKKGYEMNRNDVRTIASSFSKYGLLEKSVNLDESWHDDNNFVKRAKKIMVIKPDLSLYDLTRLRPEEAKKLLAETEYITFACSKKLNSLLTRHRRPCELHLCEKISREFFRRWALDSLLELTRYKLPILCSEMIIERLKNEDLSDLLLKNRADPNLPNAEGLTPLHILCKSYKRNSHDLLKKFFNINDEMNQTVQIDAKDKSGRTPLQLAVANFSLDMIDILLDRGADLSGFVFPNESYFGEITRTQFYNSNYKLRLTTDALAVVERLEARGYELDRSGARTILQFFAEHEVFEKSGELDEDWYVDEVFAKNAKKTLMRSGLTLYDWIQLRPEEAAKAVTFREYHKFACSKKLSRLPKDFRWDCALHLSEVVARRFCCRWALDFLLELTGYRLPILCCEIIIDKLMNYDLCRICLAAINQNREVGEMKCKNNRITISIKKPARGRKSQKKS